MKEVLVKTCSGFERYVWLDGALVRAEDNPFLLTVDLIRKAVEQLRLVNQRMPLSRWTP